MTNELNAGNLIDMMGEKARCRLDWSPHAPPSRIDEYARLSASFSIRRSLTMRSIFAGIIMLSASMAIVDAAQAQKHPERSRGHGYRQALIAHRQPTRDDLQPAQENLERIDDGNRQPDPPARRDGNIDAGQVHSEEDALTKRIEQDNARLDRVIRGICASC